MILYYHTNRILEKHSKIGINQAWTKKYEQCSYGTKINGLSSQSLSNHDEVERDRRRMSGLRKHHNESAEFTSGRNRLLENNFMNSKVSQDWPS